MTFSADNLYAQFLFNLETFNRDELNQNEKYILEAINEGLIF